jgi:hypothetical protein
VIDCPANSLRKCFDLSEADSGKAKAIAADGLSKVYFIKLDLKDRAGTLLSENFYWQSRDLGDYRELSNLKRVKVSGTGKIVREGETRTIVVDLHNSPEAIALMTRVKLVDLSSGRLVAPVLYSDNYFLLLAGESKKLQIRIMGREQPEGRVSVQVEGWNVLPLELTQLDVK